MRMYEVTFELKDEGAWFSNFSSRTVSVDGGAEEALKLATEREKDATSAGEIRAQSVALLGIED